MAKTILKNCNVRIGGYSLASVLNELSVAGAAPEVNVTNFGSAGWDEFLGGLKSSDFSFEGFLDLGSAGQPDLQFFTDMGATARPVSATLDTPVAGDVAYFANALSLKHYMGGKIGEAAKLSLMLKGQSPLIRGRVLENNAARTATGNGAAYELGAVSATQTLYYAVHVTAASGTTPTLDLLVASDDASSFLSSTTRATIPQFTAVGSYYGTVAGPITDTWYRIAATVGGTTPSFTYFAVIGIL